MIQEAIERIRRKMDEVVIDSELFADLALIEQALQTQDATITSLRADNDALREITERQQKEIEKRDRALDWMAHHLNNITGTCPPDALGNEMWDDCDAECKNDSPAKCWIKAALEAAKETK